MKHTKTIKPTISGQGTAQVMLQIGSYQNKHLIAKGKIKKAEHKGWGNTPDWELSE